MSKRDATVNALNDAYAVLADIHHEWPGRNTPDGQALLSDMRNAISEETGLSEEFVQDNARSTIVRSALIKKLSQP